MVDRALTVTSELGLHARAAAKVIQAIEGLNATVFVRLGKRAADARSTRSPRSRPWRSRGLARLKTRGGREVTQCYNIPPRGLPTDSVAIRQPRVIVFDDDDSIRNLLHRFLLMRQYEVLSYDDPTSVCSVNGKGRDFCGGGEACCDILITDINMPGANGIDLLEHQARKGCKLGLLNKLVISGAVEDGDQERLQALGHSLFTKPFSLTSLSGWLAGCEQWFDLTRPLSSRRREERFDVSREIAFTLDSGIELSEGVIVNMSASGLCIKVETPLQQGRRLRIENSHFPSARQATVRWARTIAKGVFLAGVHSGPG